MTNRFDIYNDNGILTDTLFGTIAWFDRYRNEYPVNKYAMYDSTESFSPSNPSILSRYYRDHVVFHYRDVMLIFFWKTETFQFSYLSQEQREYLGENFENEFLKAVGYCGGFEKEETLV